jgi:hypothetical protein
MYDIEKVAQIACDKSWACAPFEQKEDVRANAA